MLSLPAFIFLFKDISSQVAVFNQSGKYENKDLKIVSEKLNYYYDFDIFWCMNRTHWLTVCKCATNLAVFTGQHAHAICVHQLCVRADHWVFIAYRHFCAHSAQVRQSDHLDHLLQESVHHTALVWHRARFFWHSALYQLVQVNRWRQCQVAETARVNRR